MEHRTAPSLPLSRRQILLQACGLGLGFGLLPASAMAQAMATKFANYVRLGNTDLVLNGKGTRTKAFFKVYDMALYTPTRVRTAQQLLSLPGPKRLSMVSLRNLKTADIGLMFIKGMKANCPPEVVARYTPTVTELIHIFSFKSNMDAGVMFSMDFEPGKGTAFVFNGQQIGERVGDDEFFANALKIWFGPEPVDSDLEKALLGKVA
jgi:Chalcone isomerase-like